MQVPVKEREKLLKKEGLDPTRLTNLTLVYKVQEVPFQPPLSMQSLWLTLPGLGSQSQISTEHLPEIAVASF